MPYTDGTLETFQSERTETTNHVARDYDVEVHFLGRSGF